jgi:catechol 2,3-dioxygenase
MTESVWDIAHIAHVELFSPKPDESLAFFTDIMGMSVSGRLGESVYLRAYDDYEHHTLKLTASHQPGIGHFAWRARSPEALERRVAAIEQSGLGVGWTEGDLGHGPAYAFKTPDDHNVEVYYETEWYQAGEGDKPALKNQASRFPGRGVNLRRLDHLNLLAKDIPAMREFHSDVLGARLTEMIRFDDGSEKAVWFSVNNKSYDLAIAEDHTGSNGRLHHVTYAVNSREEVLLAADICLETGVFIETGPHKHAIQQTFFLYTYEPGGNRFEIAHANARLILAPDWKTIVWNEAERKKGQAWGLQTVSSFHTHGTPPVEEVS